MTRIIYKYPLIVTDIQEVQLPEGAQMLSVQTQQDVPQLWALVYPDNPLVPRMIVIHGTGHLIAGSPQDSLVFLDTFQLSGGALVFHAFELLIRSLGRVTDRKVVRWGRSCTCDDSNYLETLWEEPLSPLV